MAESRICIVDGCGKVGPIRKGFCEAHYRRFKKFGDPLAGRTTVGAPLAFLEEALRSNVDHCITWPFARISRGYAGIQNNGRRRSVARIICERLYGPSPSSRHQAAHSCGRGHEACVNPRHLRWASTKENAADRLAHGTAPRGEGNGHSKLSSSQVKEILSLKGKLPQTKIAERFGIGQTTVSNILIGRTWSHPGTVR